MNNYIYLCAGGMIGAGGRYWLSTLVSRIGHGVFPYGTLVVNVVGCFERGPS